MLAASQLTAVTYGLAVALIAAFGALGVGWRRLSIMGSAERNLTEADAEKRAAEKQDIIETATGRATTRAIEALELALKVTERQRDREHEDAIAARADAVTARLENNETRARLVTLEGIVERRISSVESAATKRLDDCESEALRHADISLKRIEALRAEVTRLGGQVDEINNKGRVGDQGPPGDQGPRGDPGPSGRRADDAGPRDGQGPVGELG